MQSRLGKIAFTTYGLWTMALNKGTAGSGASLTASARLLSVKPCDGFPFTLAWLLRTEVGSCNFDCFSHFWSRAGPVLEGALRDLL